MVVRAQLQDAGELASAGRHVDVPPVDQMPCARTPEHSAILIRSVTVKDDLGAEIVNVELTTIAGPPNPRK